jgi:UMF1 family MFS transporter
MSKSFKDESLLSYSIGGESNQPVTKSELWGFYSYGFGSEPFSAVVLGVCAPVILETLSSLVAFDSDTGLPCDTSNPGYRCSFYMGSLYLTPSSFALFVNALSAALQAVVFVGISSLADHGRNRKKMLLASGSICAVFLILLLAVYKPSLYWLAAICIIICNVSFGASYVFYYAYVPTLTRYDPEVIESYNSTDTEYEKFLVAERVGNKISSWGFVASYSGAIVCLVISIAIILLMDNPLYSLQVASAANGVWYLIFIVVTWKLLKSRPGPPLPQGENYFLYSWKTVFKTISQASKLSQVFILLSSWFIMSDALGSIAYIAVLFAKTELAATQVQLFIAASITPVMAAVGCIFWMYFQRFFQLRTKTMILIISVLYLVIPIFGVASIYITSLFRSVTELYIIGAYHGFLIGAIQSFNRALFAELLPPGKENELFGLYEITDKGSSWIGPLVVGAITNATGTIRMGFIFLIVNMVVPIFLTLLVNTEKGKDQARKFNKNNCNQIYQLNNVSGYNQQQF